MNRASSSRRPLASVGRASLASLAALVLVLSGCLDYQEELTLARDGSGTLRIRFTLDMKYMDEVSRLLGDDPESASPGPTRDEIMEGLKVEGITVQELDVQTREQKTRVSLLLAFQSLDALNRIEGFGDDRRLDFYDEGEGRVRVVYSFDTTDVVPVDDEMQGTEQEPDDDPVARRVLELTREARAEMRFRARVLLPGPILRSNGRRDERDPNAALWRIDREADPERHARLGRGKLRMMLLVNHSDLPFVTQLQPLPSREGDDGEGPPSPPPGPPPGRPGGGLGD